MNPPRPPAIPGTPPPPPPAGGKDPAGGASKGGRMGHPLALPAKPPPAASGRSPVSTPALPDRARQDLWVARLQAGDASVLREVVDAFSERITSVVAGMLRDRDAVDDVVQETFVKAWYRIRSFHGESGLYTWLYRIAVNASKDHVKRRRRRPAVALEDADPGATLPSHAEPAVESLERRETRLRVRAAIRSLPSKFRAVLVLREMEGLRYEEIAEVLGISLGTVESRLFRARRRLRAKLLRTEPTS